MADAPSRRRQRRSQRATDAPADDERGLRGLVGAGPSQVGVSGAMRARDAARPTEADLAAAEQQVRLVRRNYKPPPDDAAPSGSSGRTRERS